MPPVREKDTEATRPIPVVTRTAYTLKGFRGGLSKRIQKYFLSGIDPDSTENDLRDFLTVNDVMHTEMRFFKSRCSENMLAKVTIWEENAVTVESEGFWPYGVQCRSWLTRPELCNYYKHQNEHTNVDNENES